MLTNYNNYFTEIESYFQCKRNVFTTLNSLDWVLMENWKENGVPLETVLRGIDRAFSKRDPKRRKVRLAYCVNAIEQVSSEEKDLKIEKPVLPEVTSDEISGFIAKLVSAVERLKTVFPEFSPKFESIARTIAELDLSTLREAEQTLTALEEKLIALLKVACSDATLLEIKREVDSELSPFRSRMTTEQLTMIEYQMWRRKLMERFEVPRLSLFYLI